MHRLFWKLFLSFWAALLLFSVALIVAASLYLEQLRARQDAPRSFEWFQRQVAAAQAAADSDGMEGLRRWARGVDRDELVPILVLDEGGQDILDRDISARALRHLRRGPRGHAPPGMVPRLVVRLSDGPEFTLVPDFQSVTLGRVLGRPRVVAVPLILATLAGGIVCLLLARYLAAPIERLRRATVAYAAGDFSERVGPSLGRRRDEIVDLAHALDDMAARLDALIRSRQTLLRDISHELRSPLARVQAALGLARQRTGGAAEAQLERIERETERLNELIGQILSLSRLESGAQAPRREPVEVDGLLRDVLADAAVEAQARGCCLQPLELAAAAMDGDPTLLHSALENVVRNAIRHAPPGTDVDVSLSRATGGDENVVVVADRGPGVPEQMLSRIFEPFVRVDEARDAPRGGSGLGLAIAERAVRSHGGSIQAANRPGGGLTVIIRLPAATLPPT
jgi:two-component system sensor histidine kinase CpxA